MTDQQEPKLHKKLYEDIQRGDFRRTIARDYRDLKQFMITEERQARLAGMGRFKKIVFITWWLFQGLLLRLTPARRILLAIAIALLFFQDNMVIGGSSVRVSFNFNILSMSIVFFILMLELKDKLLAREELEAGRAVQLALTPPRRPDVPGWHLWLFSRPANDVGGDLVDFVKITDKRFGVAVGDVAGKGLKAALLTAKLQSTLRALVTDFTSLSKLTIKLNQIFWRDSLPSLFASMVYVELQPNSGTVRFVNAGHLPPLILRGTSLQKTEKGGAALGLLASTSFPEKSVELKHDDMLLIYSDGLTEAQNEAGDFFGEQRLLDLLPRLASSSTDAVGEGILAELDRFIGEARAADDVSIALLRRM
jgi:sigma-B regulation protein RsbU (phosphoserine phosphatase)